MKKKSIFLMLAVTILLAGGCNNKEADAVGGHSVETKEISTLEEIPIEDKSKETQQIVVEGNNGVIRIGTTGTPYSELLTQAKIQLAKKGWDLQIETYSDHEKINQDVLDGKLDAHLFAHQTYIDSYNDIHSTGLTAVARICFEKYGIYSLLNDDLTKINRGVLVGIPEDNTRKAKALLFLQDCGYITLKENVGLTAITEDIVKNPGNIEFVTYTQENVQEVLKTSDYCVMGADQAILAGLEPHKEVLKEETVSSESAFAMAALLVTTVEKTEAEGLSLLEKALKSDETKQYIEDTYKGALGLFP